MSDPSTLTRPSARTTPASGPGPREHFVRFYDDDGMLYDVVGEFLERGLAPGDGVLVIATSEHRAGLDRVLSARGVDLPAARGRGQLVELDAEETLSKFMVGGLSTGTPDPEAFKKVVGSAVAGAAKAFPGVRAYGEMVNVLFESGNETGAVRLEQLWNELAQAHSFQLYCAYRFDLFGSADRVQPFKAICSLHSHVLPPEASGGAASSRDVAELQQRTRALEAEIIARKAVEEALRERERELQDFLETASECLHGVDPDGRIVWANTAELELLGYAREEYLGKPLAEVHADQDVLDDLLARLARGERLLEHAARLRAKDGSIKDVVINSTPLYKDGRLVQTRCFTRDVSARKRAGEAQARLAAIVSSSDDAIIGKTLAGKVTSWNGAAERMFGYTASEAVGQHITLIIPKDRRDEETEVLARLRRGERIDHFETVRRTKDGRMLDISLTVSPIRNEAGEIIGASKVARDVTDRKRAEVERQRLLDKAQEARKEAEHALQIKDEFLATVSHELRSPLNAIVGWAHLLRTGSLDAEGSRRAVDTISRNVAIQNQLIADILDVQLLNSGKFRLNIREDVDIALAVEAAIDTVRPAAQAKGITLVPALENVGSISADGDRIQQIVWNLLSNAVKFTPNGGVVRLHLCDAQSHLELSVEDSGPGVKPEFLPFIFQRFRQDPSTGGRKGGLGLGLAIVRNLAELHGGTVTATNRDDRSGAVFTVRLPRVAVRVAAVTPKDASGRLHDDGWRDENVPALHGVRVLVVDDEPDAREVLAAVLGQCGADVTVATSAAHALRLLAREPPDVLVCDIHMPDEDGYSLLRKVRALSRAEGGLTPAAALTSATSADDRLRALRAGFQMHVPKPVVPAELAAVVANLAARTRTE